MPLNLITNKVTLKYTPSKEEFLKRTEWLEDGCLVQNFHRHIKDNWIMVWSIKNDNVRSVSYHHKTLGGTFVYPCY